MKKLSALLLAACLFHQSMFACTTFVLKTNNGLFFGRNLDWVSEHGIIVINQRNTTKTSLAFPPEKSIGWTSRYGSISFNQFGKEFPYGGINEKGLVVEIMRSEADYAEADERPIVNELQWVQYQLDNCATIDEVIATDSLLRIGQTYEGLHYLICDAGGNSAVIEFLDGKMVFYKNNSLPVSVLENEPYSQSLKSFNNNQPCRFTTAANLIKKYNGKGSGVDYSFNILDQVALSAEWSVVYDITQKQIHFKTNNNKQVRMIDMKAFDFACAGNTSYYNISQSDKGNISPQFTKLNLAKNTEILKKALELNQVELELSQIEFLLNYFKMMGCNN